MSKMDNQRAMREAKYARTQARATGATGAATREPRPPVAPVAPVSATPQAAPVAHGQCGHRSMNGRTCTRDSGHGEKSHRYG